METFKQGNLGINQIWKHSPTGIQEQNTNMEIFTCKNLGTKYKLKKFIMGNSGTRHKYGNIYLGDLETKEIWKQSSARIYEQNTNWRYFPTGIQTKYGNICVQEFKNKNWRYLPSGIQE